MDHEIDIGRGDRQRAARNRRCINNAVRACIIILLLLLGTSMALMVLGLANKIMWQFGYGGMAGLPACMIPMYFLIRYELRQREDSALRRRINSIRQWAGRMLNTVRRRGVNDVLAPQDDSVPLVDEPTTEERTDDPPLGEGLGENRPRRRPQSEIGMLARVLIRRHSDPEFRKAVPAESREIRELRQYLNAIPSEVPGPVRFWQSRPGEGLDIQALNLLQPFGQPPSWQLARPREPDLLYPFGQPPSWQLARPREPDQPQPSDQIPRWQLARPRPRPREPDQPQPSDQVQSWHLPRTREPDQLQPSAQVPSRQVPRPWVLFDSIRRSRRVTDSNVERQNLQTLDVRQLPDQTQSWRMARPEAPIPGSACELRLRHPPQRPGLPAWPWQTPVVEVPRRDQPSSTSVRERARLGQSWPLDFTMSRPQQHVVDELSTPRRSSELARPWGLPPLQQSRRLTGDDARRPDPQILDVQQLPDQRPNLQVQEREYLPIPGAVSELETGSKDPVPGQDLPVLPRQVRPARGPCSLVSQQEPGTHLQISPLRERPAQAQCPLVSQRQQGPLRIRQRASQGPVSEDSRSRQRASQGPVSEDSRSQQEPSEESQNPNEETRL